MLVQRSDVGEFRRRYKWMVLFTVLAFFALLVRLFQLQIVNGDDYRAEARHNIIYDIRLATTRGIVRDNQGKVLAANRPSYNVYVVPSRLDMKDTWPALADYLRLSVEDKQRLEKKLEDIRADKGSKKLQQILIREDISRDVVASLETHAAELRGVDVVAVPVRYYPQGETGAHALGYMAQIDADTLARLRSLSYVEGDRIGAAGVERAWESYLRGTRGWEKTVVDARGIRHTGPETKKFIEEPRRLDPVPGRDLRLTLDVDLQQAIEKAMRGHSAGAVTVVDVRTGRLLGLLSKPAYDSNELSGGEGVDVIRSSFRKLNVDPLQPMLDKTMSGAYPPGSTFKPFSALAALEDKILDPRTKVKCTGYYAFGRRIFKCMHVHGQVELHEAIVKSCNVYFWHLAEAVGMDRIAKVALDFGLGQKTGIGVNPEAAGRIPTHAWTTLHHKGQFRVGYTLNLAIGQGAATVTVLQLALAYAALANGGTLYQPQIVRAVESSDSSIVQDFPPRVRRSLSIRPENLAIVDDALRGVVTEEGGTAYEQRLNDVDMSGKTGTAQTSQVRERDIEPGRAWYFNRAHAWFAGFAPAKSPEIAIVVLIEHGGAGNRAAVPVAMQVAREYQKLQAARLATRPATARSGQSGAGSKKP
ncbi:MAG: penicillin-binding protein 2 [Polyangiaceae bacterium]